MHRIRHGFRAAALALALVPAGIAHAGLLAVGDLFPAWTLRAHDGSTVSSASLAGRRYVLWFYPRAMTPGCTAEGRAFRDRIGAFRERNVDVFGVSFDDVEANARFAGAEQFPFKLLSDPERILGVAVGAAAEREQGAARRISYVVGTDGRVERVYGTVSPAEHPAAVLGDLGRP